MVSVCMATRNGASYIRHQLNSILPQLAPTDELIISDDCSTDDTVDIINSYHDLRIKLYRNPHQKGIIKNFECSLKASTGDYIFLADQDDLWVPDKISMMVNHLQQHDLVVSDCLLINNLFGTKSFFNQNKSGKGLIKNIVKNSYMGCCMAFTRRLLNRALPFPQDIPMHDFWIGLIGELYFNVHFIPEILVHHRRHGQNASTTGGASALLLYEKMTLRYRIIKNLFFHKTYAK